MKRIAIIGGGPAGLMAAESALGDGIEVHLYDAKPSVGRKLLVAGKSGLNITNTEDWPAFKRKYASPTLPPGLLDTILDQFDSGALRRWVSDLGLDTFSVRSGKVFPRPMKSAPLLRAWISRLKENGVKFHMRHHLRSLSSQREIEFATANKVVREYFDAIILAMGGASWAKTGSDGLWTEMLAPLISTTPWQAANCGWNGSMPDSLRHKIEGHPLKNLTVSVGSQSETGELMPTRYGFEGTPLYALGPALRQLEKPAITIDFKPMFSLDQLKTKMESVRRNFITEAPQRWKLTQQAAAIIEHYHGPFDSVSVLAQACKSCQIPLTSPRPLEEAISSAGGLAGHQLNERLMLASHPGIYACGEMVDWEAPTGGYLLQACFATGRCAGISAKNDLS